MVRRYAGYRRYEGPEAVALLNEVYGVLRLYINFFLPSMRLVEKVREGSRVTRRYDRPQTSYERVLASETVSEEDKVRLRAFRAGLNVVQLRERLDVLQARLLKLSCRPAQAPPLGVDRLPLSVPRTSPSPFVAGAPTTNGPSQSRKRSGKG